MRGASIRVDGPLRGAEVVHDEEVTAHLLAIADAGSLIPMCAWCGRIQFGADWVQPPSRALVRIDLTNTVSHTICPTCAAEQGDGRI